MIFYAFLFFICHSKQQAVRDKKKKTISLLLPDVTNTSDKVETSKLSNLCTGDEAVSAEK